MAQPSTKLLAGPAYIASTATNIYNNTSTLLYTILRHIHVANITGGAVAFTLCLSTTGDATNGTNLIKGYSLAANSTWD